MLGLIIGLTSCKKENKNEIQNTNNLTVDATSYTLTKGVYIDYENTILYGNTNTHYNYEFLTTDGSFVINSANELDDVKGKIAIYVDLYSSGIGSFKAGIFNFVDDSNDGTLTAAQLKTKYENKNVFKEGFIVTGTVADASLGNNTEIGVKSGTVTIEGTKPNFKVIYNLILKDNKTVKGSYTGSFIMVN
jgi:hypothetical protein